ncbi:MAG: succinate dehydrogenase [Chloroflexota bacterium]|nr:succinate dehydrogenase [Chloroflexota bacterium]
MTTMATSQVTGSRSRFEALSWYFMRISGLVLLFVAVGHLMFMHVLLGVDRIDYSVIIGRWASPFWQLYDLALLLFALLHGANGGRWVIDDWVHPRGWNLFVKTLLYGIVLILFLMGAQVIFTYQPSSTAINAFFNTLL